MQSYLKKILQKETLTTTEAQRAMAALANEDTNQLQSAAFLAALHMRGETQEELLGFLETLGSRSSIDGVFADEIIVDPCGTGGDHANTFNISTAAGLIAASLGVKIAKHSGRAVSSHCGSVDVLQALKIKEPKQENEIVEQLTKNYFVFLNAADFNPILKHVAIIRNHLKIRTCFNILGPLLHPLKVKYRVLGVYSKALLLPMAQLLQRLEIVEAMVVHARDGLDEFSVNAVTDVIHLKQNELYVLTIDPKQYGLTKISPHLLQGGNAQTNAQIIEMIFKEKNHQAREVVMLNCAAILMVAGAVTSMTEGLSQADEALRSGRAYFYLQQLQAYHSARYYA